MSELFSIANICQRIRQLRIEHAGPRGKASFARDLDLSPSTYDYYENDRLPPADVLLRIANLTGVDLRWLLSGESSSGTPPADHPAVARAVALLAEHPEFAEPLKAFLDLLSAAGKFPAKSADPKNQPGPALESTASARQPALSMKQETVTHELAAEGLVPILGRSAAGVAQFWTSPEQAEGLTHLDQLIAQLPSAQRRIQSALAIEEDPGQPLAVQIVTLREPLPPGTAEFLEAGPVGRRHERTFAIRIDGASMEPDIRHGDLVVLSPGAPAEQGKPAVVQLAGQIGVTCKLFRREGDTVHLVPINEHFPPQSFPAGQLVWALKVLARVRPG